MSQLIPSTRPLRTFEEHEGTVKAVAVLPDKRRIVTGSNDYTLRLWDLETGVVLKKMEGHSSSVEALAVSRNGQIIASGDYGGKLIAWQGETVEPLTQPIKAHPHQIHSLDFSPDGTVLASGGWQDGVKLWCTKTWQMQGEPIECDFWIRCVRYSPSGELLAIATDENIQVYNPGTSERVASFKGHAGNKVSNSALAWTLDGTRLLSGGSGNDPTIREWDPSTWEQAGNPWEGHTGGINAITIHPAGTLVASASHDKHVRLWRLSDRQTIAIFQHSSTQSCITFSVDGEHILSGGFDKRISEWAAKGIHSKIVAITTTRDACLTGDLSTAEELLTREIHTDANDYTSYAHRSFVMARKQAWDHALDDAIKSISIQPSLTGYISKGIALCGKGLVREARIAFDVASMFTNQDSDTNHFLLLIKAIAFFNADQHEEAMLLVKELAAACPTTDPLGCHVVETYLRVQLGTKALDGARYDEAADYFTIAVNSSAFLSKNIHETYEDLTVLFGWNLESLCLTAHQKRCKAFLSAGKPNEGFDAHQYMMNTIDETAKVSCLDWSNEFKEQCSTFAALNDRILGAEVPRQDQDDYDTKPNLIHGMQQTRPQQRPGRLKRLGLAMTRTPRSALSPTTAPAPTPAPPTTPPPATAFTTITARLGNLFIWRSDHARPPVVDVPLAQDVQCNAAAGAPGSDDSLIRDEDYHRPFSPDPNLQQQQQPVAAQVDSGEHGGGRSYCW